MSKLQRIRDPIHDLIEFDTGAFEQMCWRLISSAPMQKLRRVKQLGFSDFVFPGATHSRFAHSVGVFHTARTLAASVKRGLPEDRFDSQRAQAAMAAALLHDVGHGPFSHAFESVLSDLKLSSHEAKSVKLINSGEIADTLNAYKPGFASEVADIIGSEKPRDIYSAIVSSQFDADRLDYMRRDRKMTGVQSSHIDFEWIVKNLETSRVQIGQDDIARGEIETLVVGKKALRAAEGYVLSLFHLYPNPYLHKTTRGAEKIFGCLLRRIIQLAIDGDVNKTGLPSNHPLIDFSSEPNSIQKFLRLDDYVVWGALPLLCDAKDKIISEFAERLQNRKLFKAVDVTTQISIRIKNSFPTLDREELQIKIDRAEAQIRETVQSEIAEMERKGKKPTLLADFANRNPYKRHRGEETALKKIFAFDQDGELRDLADVSDVVRTLKPFKAYRVYVSEGESASEKKLQSIIGSICYD